MGSDHRGYGSSRRRSAGGPAVLLVDDEPDIRLVLRVAFAVAGYAVFEAENGAAALAVLRDPTVGRVDAVVTDGLMPEMPGPELVHAMRADPVLRIVPVVAFDSLRLTDWVERWGIGLPQLAAFVEKPCDPRKVVDLVQDALSRWESGR